MQERHVYKLLDEASAHLSNGVKLDGTGNVESALEHCSAGVEKLDAIINDITDEKTRSFYTKDRAAVTKSITAIEQSANRASQST